MRYGVQWSGPRRPGPGAGRAGRGVAGLVGVQLHQVGPAEGKGVSSVYTSQNPVISNYIRNLLLTALSARPAAALWPTPKVRLSSNPSYNPQPTDPLATYVANESAFSGYVAQTPTFVVPVNRANQTVALIATVVFEAAAASPFVPGTVYGYWGDDGTNPLIAEAAPPGSPWVIGAPDDYIQINVIWPYNTPQSAA